jgi:predicted nucleic acid-binding protein
MKVTDALREVTRLFLDSAPVIYYVERNPDYTDVADIVFDLIEEGRIAAVTSPVTLAECLVMPLRRVDAGTVAAFEKRIVSGKHTYFVPVADAVARQAAALRARYNLVLPDAFQIAAALVAGCEAFLTNDAALKRVTELRVLALDELEL